MAFLQNGLHACRCVPICRYLQEGSREGRVHFKAGVSAGETDQSGGGIHLRGVSHVPHLHADAGTTQDGHSRWWVKVKVRHTFLEINRYILVVLKSSISFVN